MKYERCDHTDSKPSKCRFAIVGAAGYIAPRHIKAIHSTGNTLVAAHDLSDSVGILDSYFPMADFTTDTALFVKRLHEGDISYLSVCTPNHLHCPYSLMGLEAGVDVICEKPVALSVAEINAISQAARESGHNVWAILQLRHHPEILKLKRRLDASPSTCSHVVDLTYITPRGKWYGASWKGDAVKSGGVVCNIGIHFIDMLLWMFGPMQDLSIHYSASDAVAGVMTLKNAYVRFFLSINASHRPVDDGSAPMSPYRNLTIDGETVDFTGGFTELHTLSYSAILNGNGFSLDDASEAIGVVEEINRQHADGLSGAHCHPYALQVLSHRL